MHRKYPVQELSVGESVTLPWRKKPGESNQYWAIASISQKSLYVAVWREQRKTGKKFTTQATPAGLMVTRLA